MPQAMPDPLRTHHPVIALALAAYVAVVALLIAALHLDRH